MHRWIVFARFLSLWHYMALAQDIGNCDGCQACTDEILATETREGTCEALIRQEINQGLETRAACAAVAEDYPLLCGPHW